MALNHLRFWQREQPGFGSASRQSTIGAVKRVLLTYGANAQSRGVATVIFANSRWFVKTSIILFLNKIDRFKEKLVISPMKNYFLNSKVCTAKIVMNLLVANGHDSAVKAANDLDGIKARANIGAALRSNTRL